MDDNKNQKRSSNFQRLAEKRTELVLERLRILGNLSNRKLYSFSDMELEKVLSAIDEGVKELRVRFKGKKRKPFKL